MRPLNKTGCAWVQDILGPSEGLAVKMGVDFFARNRVGAEN